MTHELKTWPKYFWPILMGVKNFDIRVNDRDFKVGDKLVFCEFNPITGEYTGRRVYRQVAYILKSNPFIKLKNKVILSFI